MYFIIQLHTNPAPLKVLHVSVLLTKLEAIAPIRQNKIKSKLTTLPEPHSKKPTNQSAPLQINQNNENKRKKETNPKKSPNPPPPPKKNNAGDG